MLFNFCRIIELSNEIVLQICLNLSQFISMYHKITDLYA